MHILIVLGYWNPTGFIPKFCLMKIIYLVGNWWIDDEEAIGNMQIDANCKKALHFISLIKQCRELALTTHKASQILRRRAWIMWEHIEGDLREWSQHKGDVLYQLANYCEKRVLNLKRLMKELIQTLHSLPTLPINWEGMVVLPPPFHRILWDSICTSPIDPWV